jgi:hypothetical protein
MSDLPPEHFRPDPGLTSAIRQPSNAFQELLIKCFNESTTSDPILQPAQNSSDEAVSKIRRIGK